MSQQSILCCVKCFEPVVSDYFRSRVCENCQKKNKKMLAHGHAAILKILEKYYQDPIYQYNDLIKDVGKMSNL